MFDVLTLLESHCGKNGISAATRKTSEMTMTNPGTEHDRMGGDKGERGKQQDWINCKITTR